MKVGIITVAYNYAVGTERLFKTAMLDSDKHDITFYLFLHGQGEDIASKCKELTAEYPSRFFDFGINRGLSKSWNDGILAASSDGCGVIIIANDDIYFSPDDINKIVKKSLACRSNYMISVAGMHIEHNCLEPSHGYSCFSLNPIGIEVIGAFDENFFPIYMEDCDHHYRAMLAGLQEGNCEDTEVFHEGSIAIRRDELLSIQNMATHRKNAEYYTRKWGGLNEQETFLFPFNDIMLDPWCIKFIDRSHPYGNGYDRADYDHFVGQGSVENE